MLLWFGVAAVSIPIIIHLLNKRKFERVTWAAMRFLNVAMEQNQRRVQIEDLLLLLLRCLLLLLLGLALARPAIHAAQASGVFGQSRVTGVIVLDNSYSMSDTDGVQNRFDQAKQAAEQVLNKLPAGSSMGVIFASDIADRVIPEPTYDLNLVRKTIKEAHLTDRSTNLYDPIKAAQDILKGRQALRKEIYVFTDGQLLGWRQFGSVKQIVADAAKPGQDVRTHFIFLGVNEERNVGVSSIRLVSDWATVGHPLRYDVEITNYGTQDVRDIQVSLHVDAEDASDQATIDVIAPGASKNRQLFAKFAKGGFHTVTAKLPPDHLPADDQRTIAVRAQDKVRVLVVEGQTPTTPQEGDAYYLKNVLAPVPPSQQDQYFIKVITIGPSELDNAHFDDFDAIVLADVAELSQHTLDGIASYLRRGRGGLMVFPGPNTGVKFYNETLLGKYHFLPAALETSQGNEKQDEDYFTLQEKQFQHPIAAVWADAAAGTPAAVNFYKIYPLKPDTAQAPPPVPDGKGGFKPTANQADAFLNDAGPPRTVLAFGPGKGPLAGGYENRPAIMERTWGQGRVILFSSTAGLRWNTLAAKPGVMLPLVYRTLGSLVQREDDALNISAGERFVQRLEEEMVGKDALIYKPGQKSQATDARRIELVQGPGGAAATLSYDQTDIAGEYRLVIADPPTTIKFAVQGDPAESNLTPMSDAQFKELADAAHVVRWNAGTSLEESIEKATFGTELWLPVAALVALLAIAETFLAGWFSRSK